MQIFPELDSQLRELGRHEPTEMHKHTHISDSSTQLMDHGCHKHNVITIDPFQLSKGHSAHGVDNNAHLSQINPVSTQYF